MTKKKKKKVNTKWIAFSSWVASLMVFIGVVYAANGNFLTAPQALLYLLLTDIALGGIAFLIAMFLFLKSKEWQWLILSGIISVGFFASLFVLPNAEEYLVNNPQTQNQSKASSQIDEVVLFKEVNDYREENGKVRVLLDKESCNIAERVIEKFWWQSEYNLEEYNDICPACNDLKVSLGRDFDNINLLIDGWKSDKKTKENLLGNSVYGCARLTDNKIALIFTNKNTTNNTVATSNSSTSSKVSKQTITCTGPDGKQFQSTQQECDDFNSAWGKSSQTTNTQPAKKQQTATSTLNYYCYDNTYNYWYYTSSGEQCNADNANSALYQLCTNNVQSFGEYKDCQDQCSATFYSDNDICFAAYATQDAYIEYNWDLYMECSNEVADNLSACYESCSPVYQKVFDQCMGW